MACETQGESAAFGCSGRVFSAIDCEHRGALACSVFDTVSLGAAEWKMVITAGFIPLVTAEVLKFVGMTFSIRRREARRAG